MPDENQNPTDTAAPAAIAQPGTAPASEVTFTKEQQERVNAIVAQARKDGRESALRAQAPAAAPVQAPQPAPIAPADEQHMTPKQMRDELNELKLRGRFERQALKRGIEGDAADDLYELFKAQKPTNDVEWFEAKSQRFGFKPGTPAAPTAPPATATAPAPEAPKAPPAAPVAPSTNALPTANGVVDLFSLNHAQLSSLGPQGVRENLEKLWRIGNQMSGAPTRPKPPGQRT